MAADTGGVKSEDSFRAISERLRINFRVALITNVTMAAVLILSAVAAAVLIAIGHPVPAAIFGGLSAVDVVYAAGVKPWQNILLANNRLALTEAVWLAYIETKRAIETGYPPERIPPVLGRAQNLWVHRSAIIAQESFNSIVKDIRELDRHLGIETEAAAGVAAGTDWISAAQSLAEEFGSGGILRVAGHEVAIRSGSDGGYWAEVPALPGCFAQSEDLAGLEEQISQAIETWYEVRRDGDGD